MPSHHTTKDRSSFRVSGLAVSAVYSPLAFVSSMCTYSAQASQSRAAALSFGIRLLAKPTPRQPALRNSGMFSGVRRQWQHSLCRPGIRQSGAGEKRPLSRFFLSDTQKDPRSPRSGRDLLLLMGLSCSRSGFDEGSCLLCSQVFAQFAAQRQAHTNAHTGDWGDILGTKAHTAGVAGGVQASMG